MHTDISHPDHAARRRSLAALLLFGLALVALLAAVGAHLSAAGLPPTPVAAGGGEYVLAEGDEMSPAERATIELTLAANIRRLTAEGRLPAPRTTAAVALDWPLAPAPGLSDPGYHAVTGYVDHNPAFPGRLQDFACGVRTYDTSGGYNHAGTDYYLWPFAWNKMDAGAVQVVAAAPGVIINKNEGNADRSCSFNSNKWNAVYVRHDDGSIAWYGHLKQGSVTTRAIGERVMTGDYLGLVGSSGNSTGPHLHLELYDATYQLIDPYAGTCNPRNAVSWWRTQRPYNDSTVNKIMTGRAPISFAACPNPDETNEATTFSAGDTVYFTAFYRDQAAGQTSTYRLRRPDGSLYVEWDHSSAEPFFKLSYWWWAFELPSGEQPGTWAFEVDFEGQSARQTFELRPAAGGTPEPTASSPTATPTAEETPAATPTAAPTPTRPWQGAAPQQFFIPLVAAPGE